MAFTENIDPYLTDFAVAATLPNTVVVMGIFDAAAVDVLSASGTGPQFLGKTADLSALAYGNAVSIGGVSYAVRQNQPDGTGMTTLILERA